MYGTQNIEFKAKAVIPDTAKASVDELKELDKYLAERLTALLKDEANGCELPKSSIQSRYAPDTDSDKQAVEIRAVVKVQVFATEGSLNADRNPDEPSQLMCYSPFELYELLPNEIQNAVKAVYGESECEMTHFRSSNDYDIWQEIADRYNLELETRSKPKETDFDD